MQGGRASKRETRRICGVSWVAADERGDRSDRGDTMGAEKGKGEKRPKGSQERGEQKDGRKHKVSRERARRKRRGVAVVQTQA